MIRVLTTGTLYADPQARTSQAGKPFTTAKLKAESKDGSTVWVSLVAFAGLDERLATLKAGAAIAVSGRAEVSAYLNKAGEPAAGLSVVVDELATLRARQKPKPEPTATGGGEPFDDPL